MATRNTSNKATVKANNYSLRKPQAPARSKGPATKTSSQPAPKVARKPGAKAAKSSTEKPAAMLVTSSTLQPTQLMPVPSVTTVTLSETGTELRSEVAELRGQLQALVANLGGRQPMTAQHPQVLMLQPMGMGGYDDWQARHDLIHERDDLRQRNQAQSAQIAQLLQQLTDLSDAVQADAEVRETVSAERDNKTQLAQVRAATITQLQKEVADTKSARDAEAQAKQDAQRECENLQQRIQQHEARHIDLQKESELLLAQLHQVQEELESYFLEAQALKQNKEQLLLRVTRLLKRLPGMVEWDDLAAEANQTSLTITLQQVVSADRQVPQLKLLLARQKKQPTLQVLDPEGQFPALFQGKLTSPINPIAAAGTPEAALIDQLAPSDINLLQRVCTSVAQALPAPVARRDKWAADLTLLAEQLKVLPPVWRYDSVSLLHEQVNSDYEHLWFHFDNATFGNRNWPSFEFRLSAANIRKGKFSQHPKLEFPEPGPGISKQFENWFEESEDDHGVKYELRFDLRTCRLDAVVWGALDKYDRAQMVALVIAIPRILSALQRDGVALKRPYEHWMELAKQVKEILSISVATD
jgi:hypothetical protein